MTAKYQKLLVSLFVLFSFATLAHAADFSTHVTAGSSQFWSISDASQSGLDLTTSFTLEGWVKFDSVGSTETFIGKYTSGSNRSYLWDLDGTDYRLCGTFGLVLECKSVSWSPSTATWYHIAVTDNFVTGKVDFYVDGTLQGSEQSGTPGGSNDGSAPFVIGARNLTDGTYFDGSMADFRVWGAVRDASTINANKDNCDLDPASSNLVSWWRMNGDAVDSTGSNSLSNNNSATFTSDQPYTCGGGGGATSTATTTPGNYTGPDFQEWLFMWGIFLFMFSFMFWDRLFRPLKSIVTNTW